MPNFESGKASREVVESVIEDLLEFNEAVNEEIDTIKRRTVDLEDAWKDAQYKQFKGFIEDLIDSLQKDLDVLEEARENLKEKLKHY